MALGDAYAEVADLEARLNKTDDGTFAALLDAASRAVEAYTGRQFNKATTASERLYRPVDAVRLPVDDFHTLTDLAVTVNGTVIDADGYDPRPWNGIYLGQTGWPYFDLMAVGRRWTWNRRAKIAVTAQWGWPEVPEGVKQATLDYAAAMSYDTVSVDGSVGPTRSFSIDGYSESFATSSIAEGQQGVPAVFAKAAMYRRRRFGIA